MVSSLFEWYLIYRTPNNPLIRIGTIRPTSINISRGCDLIEELKLVPGTNVLDGESTNVGEKLWAD